LPPLLFVRVFSPIEAAFGACFADVRAPAASDTTECAVEDTPFCADLTDVRIAALAVLPADLFAFSTAVLRAGFADLGADRGTFFVAVVVDTDTTAVVVDDLVFFFCTGVALRLTFVLIPLASTFFAAALEAFPLTLFAAPAAFAFPAGVAAGLSVDFVFVDLDFEPAVAVFFSTAFFTLAAGVLNDHGYSSTVAFKAAAVVCADSSADLGVVSFPIRATAVLLLRTIAAVRCFVAEVIVRTEEESSAEVFRLITFCAVSCAAVFARFLSGIVVASVVVASVSFAVVLGGKFWAEVSPRGRAIKLTVSPLSSPHTLSFALFSSALLRSL
jgi:hypothetical protein